MTISQQDKDGAVYVLPAGYSEDEFEMTEEQLAFDQFKQEAHDNENYSKLIVSRVPMNRHGQRGSQKLHFLFECGVDEFTFSQLLSKLRDEYGSGFYKVQGRNEKGQLKLNKTVAVEAPQRETETASADSGAGAVIEKVSAALQENAEQNRQMMQQFIPQANPMGSMVEMMTGLATIMKSLGISTPQPPPPPKTLVEQLTEFKMLKELMGGEDSAGGAESNIYSLMGETIKTFGGPIAAALAQGAQSGALDESGVANPSGYPAGSLPAPEPATLGEQAEMEEQQKMAMRQNIHMMIKNARANVPPSAFANILMANIPEDQEDQLWEFISAEDCVEQIIALEAAATPYREWFEKLRDVLIELMSEPEIESPGDLPPDDDERIKAPSSAVAGVDTETPTNDSTQRDAGADTERSSGDPGNAPDNVSSRPDL